MFELDPPLQVGWNDVRNIWPGCLVLLKMATFVVVSSATFGWDFIRTESTLEAEILASISSFHVLYTRNKKSGCSFGMNFTFNLLSPDIHREISKNRSRTPFSEKAMFSSQADHPLFVWCVYGWNLRLDFQLDRSVEILFY